MLRSVAIAFLALNGLAAQSFEAASVTRSAGSNAGAPGNPDALQIGYPGITLQFLIARAYGVAPDQITGPRWLGDERYDIVATLPPGATQDQVPAMLHHLLAERFGLIVHEQTKSRTFYALVAGKGELKIRAAGTGRVATIDLMSDHVQLSNYTMADFARFLATSSGRPVVDETGLSGSYEINLYSSMAEIQSVLIVRAVQQLGLKLETRTMPAKFVIVDKANKIPTDN